MPGTQAFRMKFQYLGKQPPLKPYYRLGVPDTCGLHVMDWILGDETGDCILFDVDVLAWRALSRATGDEPLGGDRWPAAPPGSHRQALTLDGPLGPERRAWVQADTVKSQCPDGALTMSMISVPLGQMISSSLPSGTMMNLPYLVPK